MSRLRIVLCVLLGHRTAVLFHDVQKSGGKKYARYVAKCDRCGIDRSGRTEVDP
jgi:hypothetical protein